MTEAPITIKSSDPTIGEVTWTPGPALQRLMRDLASDPAELDSLTEVMNFGLSQAVKGVVANFTSATLLWAAGVTPDELTVIEVRFDDGQPW